MAKINRQKLAKGTFLKSDKINEFVNATKDAVNNGTLDEDNIPFVAPTRLVFNTRCLKRDPDAPTTLYAQLAGDLGAWETAGPLIPTTGYDISLFQHFLFTLPEPQENFDQDGIQNKNTKNYTLSELVIQADNLHNPAAQVADLDNDYHTNSLSATDAMNVTVTIHRKTPSSKSGTYYWEEQIGKWEIPSTIFLDGSLSRNPYIFEDLNIKLAPDSIYLLSLAFPTKNFTVDGAGVDFGDLFSIDNVQVSLTFLSELRGDDFVFEDRGGGTVTAQNYPPDQTLQTVITTTDIVANSQITEASIQNNLEALDDAAHRKLVGSYDDHGNKPNQNQLLGYSYGVQQVPLFNNNDMLYNWSHHATGPAHARATAHGFSTSSWQYPYSGNPFPIYEPIVIAAERRVYSVADRKFIPIHSPFLIHHILLTYWTGSPFFVNTSRCEDPNTKFKVGVILHTVGRGDNIARHQIAEAEFQPTQGVDARTGQSLIVDQAYWLEQQNVNYFYNQTKETCGFTMQIPTNHGTTPDKQGKGYTTTGVPIFAGRGEYGPSAGPTQRTSLFRRTQDDTLVNYTQGQEQMLEVILKIENLVDGVSLNFPSNGTIPPESYDSSIKLQQPGAMLYLVGKTPLQNPRW